jgi:hypothetical protein
MAAPCHVSRAPPGHAQKTDECAQSSDHLRAIARAKGTAARFVHCDAGHVQQLGLPGAIKGHPPMNDGTEFVGSSVFGAGQGITL